MPKSQYYVRRLDTFCQGLFFLFFLPSSPPPFFFFLNRNNRSVLDDKQFEAVFLYYVHLQRVPELNISNAVHRKPPGLITVSQRQPKFSDNRNLSALRKKHRENTVSFHISNIPHTY